MEQFRPRSQSDLDNAGRALFAIGGLENDQLTLSLNVVDGRLAALKESFPDRQTELDAIIARIDEALAAGGTEELVALDAHLEIADFLGPTQG